MNHERSILRQRQRRSFRVRKRLHGTSQRPRLSVFRSHKHIYAQIINDDEGRTLVAASSLDAGLKSELGYSGNKQAAQALGKALAEKAKAQGITEVCFDRGPFKYHGRVAALAQAAREGGLQF